MLTQIQAWCLELPGTTEDLKWDNHPTFCVGEKMYAILSLESEGHTNITLKTTREQFEYFVSEKHFKPAPYLARYHWIMVEHAETVDQTQLKQLLEESYELVFAKLPKRLRTQITKNQAEP